MAAENQPAEEAQEVGGMDALKDLLNQQLQIGDEQDPQPEATEQTEETSPEPSEAETQPAEEEGQDDSGINVGFKKRIDKLTWKNKTLQEQLEQARQQLYESKQASPQQSSTPNSLTDQINNADTFEQLADIEQGALEAERWAKTSLRRYQRDPEKVETEIKNKLGYLPDDVEGWLDDLSLNTEFSRASDIPKRKQAIIQSQQQRQLAVQKYPWLDDPTSELRAFVDQAKQQYPGLKSLPEIDLYLARALRGYQAELEDAAKVRQQQQKRPDPTPQPGKPGASAPKVSKNAESYKSARSNVMKSGSATDAISFIKAAANNK